MRFMMLIKGDARSEAGALPDEKLLTEMGKYNEELVQAGVLLAGEGLQPTSKGTRLRMSKGKPAVVDGPFAEAKELVAGFWLIQARSKQEAVQWAKRVPGGEGANDEGEIEIRQVYELSDFPVDPTEQPDGWRDKEQQMRDAPPPPTKPGRRFMLLLKANKLTESGALPTEPGLSEMGALMEEIASSGVLLGGEGLKPSANGARVRLQGKQRIVTDGPFTETKEMIAGYLMLQTPTQDDAVAWAKRWLEIHAKASGDHQGEIEVRALFELSDFPVDAAETPDGWRQQEQRMREQLGQTRNS
jgi:hypothetical protein